MGQCFKKDSKALSLHRGKQYHFSICDVYCEQGRREGWYQCEALTDFSPSANKIAHAMSNVLLFGPDEIFNK